MSHDSAALFDRTAVHDRSPLEPLRESEAVRVRETLALIPAEAQTVLDVGCGQGKLLARIERPHVFGTDLGRIGLKHATRPVFRSSMLALPLPDASIDCVLCAEVLEHLPPDLVAPACRELFRVARHSVLVTVPHRENLLETSHRCPDCGTGFHLHGHQQSFDAAMLRALFPDASAVVERFAWKARPWSQGLLRLRTHGLGLWKFSPHTFCPKCGRSEFEDHERRLLYRLVGGLNQALNPRRTHDNWLLMRFDKAEPES